MADVFLETQITTTEAQITAIDTAILALYANPIESYQIDTGQSSQRVKKANLSELQQQKDILLDRLSTLQARRNGATLQIRPGF